MKRFSGHGSIPKADGVSEGRTTCSLVSRGRLTSNHLSQQYQWTLIWSCLRRLKRGSQFRRRLRRAFALRYVTTGTGNPEQLESVHVPSARQSKSSLSAAAGRNLCELDQVGHFINVWLERF